MRQEIELYLGGKSVEFNEPPQILFSYIRTDYTNPTVLRNSYSKTLTIEGTPANNQIFNSIYHLDKISDFGTFNPAKRMDFQLFSNGDILEQGYAKLDKINKEGKNISYDITLYGGLGEFLYNLSYDQTAEGSDTSRGGGEDRRLSSLIFYNETEPNKEFDFDITKDTVAEAWEALEKGTGETKWQYINFAPAYNGYPENDFDADKVLINTQNSSLPVTYNNNGATGSSIGFPTSIKQEDTTYRTYNNYALGELPKEMTEWEMRDLRSYLQRPVLSMKGFINAIKNPANNGGYEVDLDATFFNDANPYYSKAWFTLPLLKKDETETGESAKTVAENNVLSVSSYMGEDYDVRYYLQGLEAGEVYNGVDLTFAIKDVISGMPNEVYTSFADYNIGFWGRDAAYFSSIFVQLVGEDSNGNPIAASPIFNFTSKYGLEKGWWFWSDSKPPTEYSSRSTFSDVYTPVMTTSDKNVFGRFVKTSGNNYVWKTDDGNLSAFTVSLTDKLEYDRVYFRVTKCYHWRDYKNNASPNLNCFEEQIFSGYVGTEEKQRNILGGYTNRSLERCGIFGSRFDSDTITATTAVTGVEVIGSQVRYTTTSDIVRSGDHISKGDLLNFDGTPCDYLLSYCKLFNLYLSKDIYEKKIYIRTRDSFYNGGTIDLDKFIDRSKDINVDPLAMNSRWYDFAFPENEMCGAAEDYDFNYGVQYGKNKVQTTYEFDSSAVDLFSENIFQNAVQVQESSKYYTLRTVQGSRGEQKTVPTFIYNTINYQLFSTPNDALSSCAIIPPSGFTQTGYTSSDGREDWLPKLQLNNDNQGIEGTNILCFYGGFKTSPYAGSQQAIYYLTDDVAEMYVLNGEKPCWIWTKTEYNGEQRIAKGMTKLPIFSRMLYNDAEDKIDFTWDFGRVRNTYVPVKAYTDKATIYERWWADYIADLYNANTRVVECYVKMEGKVLGEWLRSMYWWDNTYWALTEINDYNITSYDTTKCKFVRVNDIANYTSGITPPAPSGPYAVLVPEKYLIGAMGETISAYVSCSSNDLSWTLQLPSGVSASRTSGTGNMSLTLTFQANPNDDGREIQVGTTSSPNPTIYTSFWQEGQESIANRLQINDSTFLLAGSPTAFGSVITYQNRGNDTLSISYNADWLTVERGLSWDGDVSAIVFRTTTPNLTQEVQSATITFRGVNNTAVTGTIIVDYLPNTLQFDGNGGTTELTFLNTGLIPEATSGFWAELGGDGEHIITVTAPVNVPEETRTERVRTYFFDAMAQDTMPSGYFFIEQTGGGGQLVVAPTAITAEWSGGDKYIVITAVTDWNVTSKPEWVNLSSNSGISGQSIIVVSFPEYTGESARTGNIVFSDGIRTATTVVTQNNNQNSRISVTPSSLYFSYTGQTLYLNVSAPYGNWTVASKPDWVVLTQNSGVMGYSMVGVTAPLYTEDYNRLGEIVFVESSTSASGVCQVVQTSSSATQTLTIIPSIINAENSGGTYQITVQYGNRNGDDVAFSTNVDWVSVGPVTWNGDIGTATVTVANYGVNMSREATITATGILGGDTTTFTVVQKTLPFINLNPVTLQFEQTGGTATITLQSNTDWVIDIIDIV